MEGSVLAKGRRSSGDGDGDGVEVEVEEVEGRAAATATAAARTARTATRANTATDTEGHGDNAPPLVAQWRPNSSMLSQTAMADDAPWYVPSAGWWMDVMGEAGCSSWSQRRVECEEMEGGEGTRGRGAGSRTGRTE